MLSKVEFINRLPIRAKVNLAVAFIFSIMIALLTTYNVSREREFMMENVHKQAEDLTTMYFDSLNTMMLTGTMDQRKLISQKMLARKGVVEARAIRGEAVSKQYGPGFPENAVADELDARALAGEIVLEITEKDGHRILTHIHPFRATENASGVNCLKCHDVEIGEINGAVRIGYSLDEVDAAVKHELWMSVGGSSLFLILGLILVNSLLKPWIISPLYDLMDVVNKRAGGDRDVRAVPISEEDELGKLAVAFNNMSDTTNAAVAREQKRMKEEQAAAKELQSKVDSLLHAISKVTEGDYSVEVGFVGEDAIGELARQLQEMINFVRKSREERLNTLESLQQRVDTILSVVTRAAEGDLTGRVEIEGDDAIVKLGEGIQRMIDNLNSLVTQVQHSGIQLASAVNSIAATSKQQEATVAEQAASTNEIVTTATEISATSKELVSTMDEVSHVAESTASSAESGRTGLVSMEETMNHIVEAASSISSKFEVLNEKAGNINTVVTTITKVADQTNLLSLNAAIEAEKAGEYGFGFSVVAKEIRRLADQTAVATLDIEQMVKEMQTAVMSGVMSMDKFSEQVRHSVDNVRGVSSQLGQIIEEVQTLTPRFDTVLQGMQFQSEGAGNINRSIIQLNEAAQQTVESLKESNEAIMQLNGAAHNLQSGVIKFKVGRGNN